MTEPNVQHIALALIRPGDNDRTAFRADKLRELADNIAEIGLAQPITIRPIESPDYLYEIVAGERRYRACQMLGWTHIPALVRKLTDEQASRIMLAENVHRVDIDPIDEARAYQKRMEAFKWSTAQIAKAASVGEKRVQARLLLLKLVPEAQQMIQVGQMGVQFGECLSPLDFNRQRVALKYLTGKEKPLLREF